MVADDSALFREGLVGLLERRGHSVLAHVESSQEILPAVHATHPDVLITDVRMPPNFSDDGLRAAVNVRKEVPDVAIMVLSQYVAPAYARTLFAPYSPTSDAAGLGYLLKDRVARVADFVRSLEIISLGGMVVDPDVASTLVKGQESILDALTPRERETLELMAQGLSNQQISEKLFLSAAAVGKNVSNVFSKLGMQPDEENRRVRAVLTYLTATDQH